MRRHLFLVILVVLACIGCDSPKHDAHKAGEPHEHSGGEHAHDTEEPKGHDEGSHLEGDVHLSPEAVIASGIRLGQARLGLLSDAVTLPAEVQFNPDRVAHISPLVEGKLLSVDVVLGDRVQAKKELAKLRSVELGQARAELSRATSLRDVAQQNLKRQKRLRGEKISSERSLLEAQLYYEQADAKRNAARSRLRVFGLKGGSGPDMTLKSPIDGVVVERHATRGENVSPRDTLFVVADLSRVWVIGRVYEQQISKVSDGMSASISLNAYPGRVWTGTVDFVGSTLDDATRTLPVRVELENPDGVLKPGLFGSIKLASGKAKESILVPAESIQNVQDKTVVFTPGAEAGEFVATPVSIGRTQGDHVEVLKGLKSGDQVVVDGAFVLKSELMRGELGHGHAH